MTIHSQGLSPMGARLLAALVLLVFTLVMAKSLSAGPVGHAHDGDMLLASPFRH